MTVAATEVRAEVLHALTECKPGSGSYELAREQATVHEMFAARMVIGARLKAHNLALMAVVARVDGRR